MTVNRLTVDFFSRQIGAVRIRHTRYISTYIIRSLLCASQFPPLLACNDGAFVQQHLSRRSWRNCKYSPCSHIYTDPQNVIFFLIGLLSWPAYECALWCFGSESLIVFALLFEFVFVIIRGVLCGFLLRISVCYSAVWVEFLRVCQFLDSRKLSMVLYLYLNLGDLSRFRIFT